MVFNHASFFSGIGGPDLAAEWMGWNNVSHCEINPFCKRILKYYWQNAKSYGDITQTDFTELRGTVDIVSGGFPCQPYSVAGKRNGDNDERHLWPHLLRAICEIQPPWFIGENVRGLVNWNGGLVFRQIISDLENEGFEVIPFILPACAVNAPHKRERIWFIAFNSNNERNRAKHREISTENEEIQERDKDTKFSNSDDFTDSNANSKRSFRRSAKGDRTEKKPSNGSSVFEQTDRLGSERTFADTFSIGFGKKSDGNGNAKITHKFSAPNDWKNFPTQSPICNGNDGFPPRLVQFAVSRRGRLRILKETQAKAKWRVSTLEAGGNAIVPQVMFQIFKAIDAFCKIELSDNK